MRKSAGEAGLIARGIGLDRGSENGAITTTLQYEKSMAAHATDRGEEKHPDRHSGSGHGAKAREGGGADADADVASGDCAFPSSSSPEGCGGWATSKNKAVG